MNSAARNGDTRRNMTLRRDGQRAHRRRRPRGGAGVLRGARDGAGGPDAGRGPVGGQHRRARRRPRRHRRCCGPRTATGRVELTRFHTPPAVSAEPQTRRRTRWASAASCSRSTTSTTSSPACARHGAELVGEIAQYEDGYRLCYVRGPRASSSAWPSSSVILEAVGRYRSSRIKRGRCRNETRSGSVGPHPVRDCPRFTLLPTARSGRWAAGEPPRHGPCQRSTAGASSAICSRIARIGPRSSASSAVRRTSSCIAARPRRRSAASRSAARTACEPYRPFARTTSSAAALANRMVSRCPHLILLSRHRAPRTPLPVAPSRRLGTA